MYAEFDSRNYGYSRLHKLVDATGQFETKYEQLERGGRNLLIRNKQ
ncbi:MAG: OST-HTH/LOTUS domain-containing protein [Pygmaiobacter massiliensis]